MKKNNEVSQGKETEVKKDYVAVIGGVTTINLKHPIKFNDVEIKEVKMDFNSLTGAKLCEAEVVSQGKYYSSSSEIKFGQAGIEQKELAKFTADTSKVAVAFGVDAGKAGSNLAT